MPPINSPNRDVLPKSLFCLCGFFKLVVAYFLFIIINNNNHSGAVLLSLALHVNIAGVNFWRIRSVVFIEQLDISVAGF